MNHLTEQRECKHCGKLFLPSGGAQKYCSKECCDEEAKIRDNANREQSEQNKKIREYLKESSKRRKILVNINAEAKKEGLTYGQYVARHGLT